MNRKHYDMVDAWVKKHYGDLERGVLAPEVKYKVLFKIYKKKYKKEKALRKHLEKRAEGLDTEKLLPLDDGFDSLADGVKKYMRETCEECRYYKKGEDGIKDVCTKHDKFVIPTCTCFEWERKDSRSCIQCKHCTRKVMQDYDGNTFFTVLWCEKAQETVMNRSGVCEEFE